MLLTNAKRLCVSLLKHFQDTLSKILKGESDFKRSFLQPIDALLLKTFTHQGKLKEVQNPYFSIMDSHKPAKDNHIPIVEISNNRAQVDETTKHLIKIIDIKMKNLQIQEDLAQEVRDCLSYICAELLNNVADHSGASGWAMAQCYEKNGSAIEFGVVDTGVGFLERIRTKFQAFTESYAIELAIQRGVTASPPSMYGGERNAGYGLFYISELIKHIPDSELLIASNDGLIYLTNDKIKKIKLEGSIRGVLVCFSLPINLSYDLKTMLRVINTPQSQTPQEGIF